MYQVAVACLVITALLAFINARFIKLPTTIGVMIGGILLSLLLVGLEWAGFGETRELELRFLKSIDFSEVLMQGMLSVLLFAGALHIDLSELRNYRWQIGLLAVIGTAFSTAVVGLALYYMLPLFGLSLPLSYCLVFGALISPTDPIAVLGILKSAGAPPNVRLVVSGESLFNDGVGVVFFSLLVAVAGQGEVPSFQEGAMLLAHEAGGGIILGALLGGLLFLMLRSIDSYQVEVLVTIAGVLGGYELAHYLHVSGPLAMVVAGLIIGNHGREMAMSDTTRHHVDLFWELLDEILNAVLFVLLGLEIAVLAYTGQIFLASLAVIVLTLLARTLAVGAPVAAFHRWFRLPDGAWKVLTWGGLRGGISVALALSLPEGEQRDLILALTYAVVLFSIIVQGMSIGGLIERVLKKAPTLA